MADRGCKACVGAVEQGKKLLIFLLGIHTEAAHMQAPAGFFLEGDCEDFEELLVLCLRLCGFAPQREDAKWRRC